VIDRNCKTGIGWLVWPCVDDGTANVMVSGIWRSSPDVARKRVLARGGCGTNDGVVTAGGWGDWRHGAACCLTRRSARGNEGRGETWRSRNVQLWKARKRMPETDKCHNNRTPSRRQNSTQLEDLMKSPTRPLLTSNVRVKA
jgi:hypothetical protein